MRRPRKTNAVNSAKILSKAFDIEQIYSIPFLLSVAIADKKSYFSG